jgi:hypothetical protein
MHRHLLGCAFCFGLTCRHARRLGPSRSMAHSWSFVADRVIAQRNATQHISCGDSVCRRGRFNPDCVCFCLRHDSTHSSCYSCSWGACALETGANHPRAVLCCCHFKCCSVRPCFHVPCMHVLVTFWKVSMHPWEDWSFPARLAGAFSCRFLLQDPVVYAQLCKSIHLTTMCDQKQRCS